MIGATAKYTLYLASRCEHFIGLTVRRWPDATKQYPDATGPGDSWLALLTATGRPPRN